MNSLHAQEDWPGSWTYSYRYDLQEVYGQIHHHGYAYAYQNRRAHTLQLIEESLPRGSRILDVAAAQGNFSLLLAEHGYDVVWNDLRAELADYVRMKHETGRIDYRPGNVFELEFDTLFDGVLITEVIEHVAHPDEFLRKVAALTRPGGCIVMTTPNGGYFRNHLPKFSECAEPSAYEKQQFKPDSDGHIFLLWPEEIAQLAQAAGLVLERFDLFTTPLTTGHMKTEKLLSLLPKPAVFAGEALASALPRFLKRRLMVQAGCRFRKPA